MENHLTSENFLIALLNKSLSAKEFEYVDNVELIKGKSIIVNAVGTMFLYMGDDHRRDNPIQIIAKYVGGCELVFLPIECKRAIKLKYCKP